MATVSLRKQKKRDLLPGQYGCVVLGRYMKKDGVTAAHVPFVQFNSNRKVKRRAELLGMRTAFLCWFVVEYVKHGGTWRDAVENVRDYPFARLRRIVRKRRSQKKRML